MRYERLVIALVCLVSAAPAALATPVMPPEKPREVTVAFADGAELTGTLLQLSPAAVALLVNGARREYRLDEVTSIERRGDSLANGAFIGAAVVSGLCLIVCGQGLDDSDDLAGVVIVNAALGAAIGAGLDALHSGREVLYRAPRSAPMPGRGIRPSISFRVRF